MNASLGLCVCVCMRKWRRENIRFSNGFKTRIVQNHNPNYTQASQRDEKNPVSGKASEKWRRRCLRGLENEEISQETNANLSFTYIQVVIFRLSYVRVCTENHVCLWMCDYILLSPSLCLCASGTFYRAPFKSTMPFHSHLPFIIFRALFINQHYIP